jgi:hypothetical protein
LNGATAREHLFGSLLEAIWTSVSIALVNLGIVTILFVYFGRKSSEQITDEDWHLENLPELPADPSASLNKSELVVSMVGLTLMLCWWLGVNTYLRRWIGWDPLPIVWSSIWAEVTVAAVLVLTASIGREVIGLIRPHWIRAYLAVGCILDLLALLVLVRLLTAGSYVRVATAAAPEAAGMFTPLLDFLIFGFLIAMSLIVVANGIQCAVRLRRVSRHLRPPCYAPPHG